MPVDAAQIRPGARLYRDGPWVQKTPPVKSQRDRPRMLNVVDEFILERLCNRIGHELSSTDETELPYYLNKNCNSSN